MNNPPPVEVRETEEVLVGTAREAVSHCNWVVGECAAKWTRKYARGRTDADFGELVGMSGDQVYQRRRVWETFSDVRSEYPALKWSHFYVALNWDDAPECLAWAQENEATVAEMRAWRRAQRGEDLAAAAEPADWTDEAAVAFVPQQSSQVRAPGANSAAAERAVGKRASAMGQRNDSRAELVAGVPRGAEAKAGGEYAPFRSTAGHPPPSDDAEPPEKRPQPPSPEQVIQRMTTTLERLNAGLTPELIRQFRRLPEQQRSRFVKAAGEFTTKVAALL